MGVGANEVDLDSKVSDLISCLSGIQQDLVVLDGHCSHELHGKIAKSKSMLNEAFNIVKRAQLEDPKPMESNADLCWRRTLVANLFDASEGTLNDDLDSLSGSYRFRVTMDASSEPNGCNHARVAIGFHNWIPHLYAVGTTTEETEFSPRMAVLPNTSAQLLVDAVNRVNLFLTALARCSDSYIITELKLGA